MPKLMITARMIVAGLEKRGISVVAEIPERVSVVSFFYAGKVRMIIGCTPDFTSAITIPVCRSKLMTMWLLSRETSVPLPASIAYETDGQAEAFLGEYKAIVVKPQDGAHGNGVSVGVQSSRALKKAVAVAQKNSETGTVILQQMVYGRDVRVLVIDDTVVAATYRIPARVFGDGVSTTRELIESENRTNPKRGLTAYDKQMNQINLAAAERFLGAGIARVPAEGEEVTVVGTANIGTGGESHECMSDLPDQLLRDAVAASKAARSFVCGVDFMYDSKSGTYHLIELNSSPSFGLHTWPSLGKGCDVTTLYLDSLLRHYDGEREIFND